jgi:hypothetical protein
MHTFFYIAQKIINGHVLDENINNDSIILFENLYQTQRQQQPNNIIPQEYLLIIHLISCFSVKKKWYFLKKYVMDNIFMKEKEIDAFLLIFSRIQKTYIAINRFAYIYKFKKTPIKINLDLYMNPLLCSDKNVITILQNNFKYLFKISDIMLIIKNSICNSYEFFSKPLPIKNPYNNIIFNKSTLYNIFFFIKHKNYIMPTILQNYFLCGFRLYTFEKENQTIIHEFSVETLLNSLNKKNIYNEILKMFGYYNKFVLKKNKFCIHIDFPKNKLINIMTPYLKIYFDFKFAINEETMNYKKNQLLYKLQQFFKYNPMFGRKTNKINYNFLPRTFYEYKKFKSEKKHIITFNEKHICFNQDDDNYSHTVSVENTFIQDNTNEIIFEPTLHGNINLQDDRENDTVNILNFWIPPDL